MSTSRLASSILIAKERDAFNITTYTRTHDNSFFHFMILLRHIRSLPSLIRYQYHSLRPNFLIFSCLYRTMPSRRVATNVKRKAISSSESSSETTVKRPKISTSANDPLRQPHHNAQETEDNGIVLRRFYPHEMCNARALAYNKDELPRPIEVLSDAT